MKMLAAPLCEYSRAEARETDIPPGPPDVMVPPAVDGPGVPEPAAESVSAAGRPMVTFA
jgi:hypothetical protein